MLPKMSEGKTETPVMILSTQNEMSHPPNHSSYRKYVIVAVSGIVLAAIVLTAILVGMHIFTDAQKEIVKFSYNRDQNTKEDVISDPNTNIVQYHTSSKDYEMWAVNDFNRDILVLKIQTASGTNCYVAPLNRTIAMDPSKVSAPSNPQAMQNATVYVTYQAANTPIPDSSFLSKAATDTCKGISTYWVFQKCDAPEDLSNSHERQRRRTCCVCCYCVGGKCYLICWSC